MTEENKGKNSKIEEKNVLPKMPKIGSYAFFNPLTPMIPIWRLAHVTPYSPNCKSRRSVYATAMCTMLVLFYLHQQKENYQMTGAFTKKSLDVAAIFLASLITNF